MTQNNFDGYDYASSSHFSGKISGNTISFYDYSVGILDGKNAFSPVGWSPSF